MTMKRFVLMAVCVLMVSCTNMFHERVKIGAAGLRERGEDAAPALLAVLKKQVYFPGDVIASGDLEVFKTETDGSMTQLEWGAFQVDAEPGSETCYAEGKFLESPALAGETPVTLRVTVAGYAATATISPSLAPKPEELMVTALKVLFNDEGDDGYKLNPDTDLKVWKLVGYSVEPVPYDPSGAAGYTLSAPGLNLDNPAAPHFADAANGTRDLTVTLKDYPSPGKDKTAACQVTVASSISGPHLEVIKNKTIYQNGETFNPSDELQVYYKNDEGISERLDYDTGYTAEVLDNNYQGTIRAGQAGTGYFSRDVTGTVEIKLHYTGSRPAPDTDYKYQVPVVVLPTPQFFDAEDFLTNSKGVWIFTVTDAAGWNQAVGLINTYANSGPTLQRDFVINLLNGITLTPGTDRTAFVGGSNPLTVSIRGDDAIRLGGSGSLLTMSGNQKVILRGPVLTGRSGNNAYLVKVDGAQFIMRDGYIKGNSGDAASGGIQIVNNGAFTMSGGRITENGGPAGGGAVTVDSGAVTMNGGEISNNKGGGIQLAAGAEAVFHGPQAAGRTIVISGNLKNGVADNFNFASQVGSRFVYNNGTGDIDVFALWGSGVPNLNGGVGNIKTGPAGGFTGIPKSGEEGWSY